MFLSLEDVERQSNFPILWLIYEKRDGCHSSFRRKAWCSLRGRDWEGKGEKELIRRETRFGIVKIEDLSK